MIIDAFLYAGEEQMLDLRVQTLAPVVDVFIPVTGSLSHQGERLAELRIPVERWPEATIVPWHVQIPKVEGLGHGVGTRGFQRIERRQRNGMRQGIWDAAGADSTATVMISDVDEIPDPDLVPQLPELSRLYWAAEHGGDPKPWLVLEQRFHSSALELLHPHQPWLGTTVTALRHLRPQAMRDSRAADSTPFACVPIPLGGWHFSWMGTDEEREQKLRTFSHAELVGVFDVTQRATHSNGEQLIELTAAELLDLDWPEPIADGRFWVPDAWKLSGKGGDVF